MLMTPWWLCSPGSRWSRPTWPGCRGSRWASPRPPPPPPTAPPPLISNRWGLQPAWTVLWPLYRMRDHILSLHTRFPFRMYNYNVPLNSDVWDTQTFVSTNHPWSLIPPYLETILLCFSFKRVFGTSLTEETGAIDQDPQNTAGKYFIDKNYSKFVLFYASKLFKPAFFYFHAAISPRNLRKSFSRFNFL